MKKVKIVLSMVAVVAAVGTSLVTNAAKSITLASVRVAANQTGCKDVGRCTNIAVGTSCKAGVITLFTKKALGGCTATVSGTYISN